MWKFRGGMAALAVIGLTMSAPLDAREDGTPRPVGAVTDSKKPTAAKKAANKKSAAKKKKKSPKTAKSKKRFAKKKAPPASPAEAAHAQPPEQPEPPRIAFAVSLPNDWYLTGLDGNVDVFRNNRLNATVWVRHGWEEVRTSYHVGSLGTTRAAVLQQGRLAEPVVKICNANVSGAFSHRHDDALTQGRAKLESERVVKRQAMREMALGGEVVTLWFEGQFPDHNMEKATADFNHIVCHGWVWRER